MFLWSANEDWFLENCLMQIYFHLSGAGLKDQNRAIVSCNVIIPGIPVICREYSITLNFLDAELLIYNSLECTELLHKDRL